MELRSIFFRPEFYTGWDAGWHSFGGLKRVLGLIGAVGVAGKTVISDSIPLSQITSTAGSRCFEKTPVQA